jgi:cytochrome c-type biogenesis protein CcmH/NrfF
MNILRSSCVGGCYLIAGPGTLVGQFPKRYVIMDQADEWTWFLWFAGAVLCMVLGLIVQFCHKKRREEDADPADEITDAIYI